MNLLCPSCQNPLAVPEQYAGQLMKCPLCNNNFTVPALPVTAGGPSPALAPEPESHESTPIDLTPTVFPTPPSNPARPPDGTEHEVYGVTPEPAHTPPVSNAKPPVPPPLPRFEAVHETPPAPKPPPPRPTPDGYTRTAAVTINPDVVRWMAPVCLLLFFVLTFFPWVGRYYGSYPVISQSAWGAAFGTYSVDEVFDHQLHWQANAPADEKPGAGALMILVLFFGLVAVVVGLAVAALPWITRQFPIPPHLAWLQQWRWMFVTGTSLLALLFLLLQLVTSFSIESRLQAAAAKVAKEEQRSGTSSIDAKWVDMQMSQALAVAGTRRTVYLDLAFLMLVLSAAGATATQWIETRGPGRPLPRFEVMW